jgi:glycosyltransferase involved in cell wall biosynthesis
MSCSTHGEIVATENDTRHWQPGSAPVAVVMVTLNEGHNMEGVCSNLAGWAREVFIVDSYSRDDTVDIALRHGVRVVQRRFDGFGNQWNFALRRLPITAPWTMKLDPDERLSDELKVSLSEAIQRGQGDGISMNLRLWFMGRPLPVYMHALVRLWRTGHCSFTGIAVNEYPIVQGKIVQVTGDLEHHDSPDLEHWLDKQNRYTSAEAIAAYTESALAAYARLLGNSLQRRMWLKKNFKRLPFRYLLLFLYNWLWRGAWRAGWVGYAWARLRSDVMRLIEYKRREIEITGRLPVKRSYGPGKPDTRVTQYDAGGICRTE